MLDGVMRRLIDPPLGRAGAVLARRGVSADALSLAGAVAALACGAAAAAGWFGAALALLVLSRLADGLDGAVARQGDAAAAGGTEFGGFLDIVCDFVFYAAVPLGLAFYAPGANALAAAVLLAAYYLNAATFLGFAILAARRGMTTEARGKKTLYATTGLAEGTETILFYVAILVWPPAFAPLAYGFAGLCLVTAGARILLARRVFGAARAP